MSTIFAPERTRTTWAIDASHSLVEFAIKHLVITTTKGRFARVSGTIVMDPADVTRSSVDVVIDAASIETHDAKRDEHLRSADFFDVATYPTIRFTSTRVESLGDDSFRVIGDLTIRDVTRQVVLDATHEGTTGDPWGGVRSAFSASTRINRKEFGLTWNMALETGGMVVGDDVKITLEIEAVRQED